MNTIEIPDDLGIEAAEPLLANLYPYPVKS